MIKYIATIFLFILPVYLIKKKFLRIENTLIWLILLFILSIASLNIEFIKILSQYVGIVSPVNFLIFATFLIFLFLFLNLLKKVSELNNKIEDIVIKTQVDNLTKKDEQKKNSAKRFFYNHPDIK